MTKKTLNEMLDELRDWDTEILDRRVAKTFRSDVEELRARVRELEAAAVRGLKPFAKFVDGFEKQPLLNTTDELYVMHNMAGRFAFKLSDCRRARAVLRRVQRDVGMKR